MTRHVRSTSSGPWTPNAGAQEAFANDWQHRFVALEGGWGSGKTWVGARKLVLAHVINALDKRKQPTGIVSAVGAPTYRSARDFDLPELEAALRESNIGYQWIASDHALLLPDFSSSRKRSRILIRTADRPELITGWQAPIIWLDEPTRFRQRVDDPRHDPFLQFSGRLRHPSAKLTQMMLTYTHEGDRSIVCRFMRADPANRATYRLPTSENPHVAAFEAALRKQLTPELAKQYLEGYPTTLGSTRVFNTFAAARHIDSSLRWKRELPWHLSVDFNISPGMHALLGQHDKARDLYSAVYELHAPAMDVRTLAERLVKQLTQLAAGQCNKPTLHIFGDATGANRWAGTGESCYQVLVNALGELGWPCRLRVPRSNPPVTDRVNAMNLAMADMAGRSHWVCHPRCVRLIDDLQQLRRDAHGRVDKSDPTRGHASDAESYRVWYLRPLVRPKSDAMLRVGA